jgi:hypothetical protein
MARAAIPIEPKPVIRDGIHNPRKINDPDILPPTRDIKKISAGNKNKLYGSKFEDTKHTGATRVWNKSRPLAKGGRRGSHKGGV